MGLINLQDALDAFGLSEKTRKYGGDHSGYDTIMLYEIQDILEGLPSAEPEQRWIPVTERLPEATVSVIVTSTNGYVYTSRIVSGEWEYGGNVTAWMPLPEPYAERRKG